MKKRILSILLVMVMVFTLLPAVSFAAEIVDSGTCGENLTWTLDSDGVLTISGTGPMKDYSDTYDPKKSPFFNNDSIQRIIIEEGVTSIGKCAFFWCFNASGDLVLPASLERVEDSAFLGCKFDSVIVLNPYLGIPTGTSVTWGYISPFGNATTIHAYEINCKFDDSYCSAQFLTDIEEQYDFSAHEFENGVCTICGAKPYTHTEALGENLQWTYSFEDQQRLEITGTGAVPDYTLPSYLGSSTPWEKYSAYIEDITVGEGITAIGDYTFSRHHNLLSVMLPNTLTKIGESAFYDCNRLQSIAIPNNVIEIGESAFSRCWELKDVSLPNKLTTLEHGVFGCCYALENIDLPESITSIGQSAFYGCGLTSIDIPEGVTNIGLQAFERCRFTSVIIPENVSEIGECAFCDCDMLSSVYFCGDAPRDGKNVFVNRVGWENSQSIYENIPDLILYYIEGKEGWTTPEWNGYPTAIWVPEHIHEYASIVTAPTCTEQGYTTYTCECGDSYVDDYVAALGHDYHDGVCSVCKEKDPDYAEPMEPVTFSDVKQNNWYYGAVEYAVNKKLMNGVGNNEFAPEEPMTRAMLVTVLWRYAGSPAEGENKFTDVPAGEWYTQAVAWAAKNGIVTGTSPTTFDPEGSITREQMAAILYRYAEKTGIDISKRANLSSFPDGDKTSDYAVDPLSWANAEGLINGSRVGSKTYLDPQGNATRAQVATILMRFIENIAG